MGLTLARSFRVPVLSPSILRTLLSISHRKVCSFKELPGGRACFITSRVSRNLVIARASARAVPSVPSRGGAPAGVPARCIVASARVCGARFDIGMRIAAIALSTVIHGRSRVSLVWCGDRSVDRAGPRRVVLGKGVACSLVLRCLWHHLRARDGTLLAWWRVGSLHVCSCVASRRPVVQVERESGRSHWSTRPAWFFEQFMNSASRAFTTRVAWCCTRVNAFLSLVSCVACRHRMTWGCPRVPSRGLRASCVPAEAINNGNRVLVGRWLPRATTTRPEPTRFDAPAGPRGAVSRDAGGVIDRQRWDQSHHSGRTPVCVARDVGKHRARRHDHGQRSSRTGSVSWHKATIESGIPMQVLLASPTPSDVVAALVGQSRARDRGARL